MEFEWFSCNGELLPVNKAVVPLSNIEYQYGFGVYESIRVVNGVTYFISDHVVRLMESARIIGLAHSFAPEFITKSVAELVQKNNAGACNVKILLIGGREPTLNILCLNPLFPDKKLYRDGVATVTYEYERAFPHAKTLNMLESFLAYRKAKDAGAYDALLLDGQGNILEGTRTNFFCIKGKTLFSPPEEKILLGVTRKAVLKVAAEIGMTLQLAATHWRDISEYDAAFITSTSAKILPIRSIDTIQFGEQPPALKELMRAFDSFLDSCNGKL